MNQQREPKYRVTTWDGDRQTFTPQKGLPAGPYTRMGLRAALRRLRGMGYDGGRHDPSILVERLPEDKR